MIFCCLQNDPAFINPLQADKMLLSFELVIVVSAILCHDDMQGMLAVDVAYILFIVNICYSDFSSV